MTAGASNDIECAVELARRMVSEFGMSPLGPIHLGASDMPHSQTLLDRIEDATTAIINEQLKRACVRCSKNRRGSDCPTRFGAVGTRHRRLR